MNPSKTNSNSNTKNIPDKPTFCYMEKIRLHLKRLATKSALDLNKRFIKKYLAKEDDFIASDLKDPRGQFFSSVSLIDCALSSHFDFLAISTDATKISSKVLGVGFHDSFMSVFGKLCNIVRKKLDNSTTKDPLLKQTETVLSCLLMCDPKKQLEYWQKEPINEVLKILLRELFTMFFPTPKKKHIELLCLVRPKFMREMFGAPQEEIVMEDSANLIETCFDIGAVHVLDSYDTLLIEQGMDHQAIFEKAKLEAFDVLQIDKDKEFNEATIPTMLLDLARKVQKNKSFYWKGCEKKFSEVGTVAFSVANLLKPYFQKYKTAQAFKDRFSAEWQPTILPKLLSLISNRQGMTAEQKQTVTNMLTSLQGYFTGTASGTDGAGGTNDASQQPKDENKENKESKENKVNKDNKDNKDNTQEETEKSETNIKVENLDQLSSPKFCQTKL